MAKAQTTAESNEHTFETAMQRLDQIVQAMDADDLPLEDLIVHYEEGIQLMQVCEAKLKTAEKKIEIITRKAQGAPQLAEFEPGETPAESAPAKPRENVSLF